MRKTAFRVTPTLRASKTGEKHFSITRVDIMTGETYSQLFNHGEVNSVNLFNPRILCIGVTMVDLHGWARCCKPIPTQQPTSNLRGLCYHTPRSEQSHCYTRSIAETLPHTGDGKHLTVYDRLTERGLVSSLIRFVLARGLALVCLQEGSIPSPAFSGSEGSRSVGSSRFSRYAGGENPLSKQEV